MPAEMNGSAHSFLICQLVDVEYILEQEQTCRFVYTASLKPGLIENISIDSISELSRGKNESNI